MRASRQRSLARSARTNLQSTTRFLSLTAHTLTSFDHEAWNDNEKERVVLLLDVWHPELREGEGGGRDEVRSHFMYDEGASPLSLSSP